MVYELRIYTAAPGKLAELNQRFRKLTLGLFERHGMQVVGFWEPAEPDNSELIYLLAYPSQEARDTAWDAFRSDPDWVQGKAVSEHNGPLTAHITNRMLQPTDYSPLK